MDPRAFRSICSVTVLCDSSGKDCKLDARCVVNGKNGPVELRRTINLQPVIDFVLRVMRKQHEKLHGPLPTDQVSGFFGNLYRGAVGVARRVSSNSAVKSLYGAAKKYGKYVPVYGQAIDAGMQIADKVHSRVVEARRGSQVALAKLKAIADLAKQGLPAAQQAVDIARNVNAMIKSKESLTALAPKAAALLADAKKGSKEAIDKIATVKEMAETSPAAADVMDLFRRLNDFLKSKEAVSGWTYNRPYRTPLSAVMQGSPGVGLMSRALYQQGLS